MKPSLHKAICRINIQLGRILFNIVVGAVLYILAILGTLWLIEQFLEEDRINRSQHQECPNGPRPSPSSNLARHLEM